MTEKNLSNKLAAGMRRTRPSAPATKAAPAVLLTTPATRYASQADQSPPASLDRPWDNLHPARIWPD